MTFKEQMAKIWDEPQMDENHPIYKAIDLGGGQVCDIPGVLRELTKAGYVIIKTDVHDELVAALEAMTLNMANDRKEYRDCHKQARAALAKAKQEIPNV